MRLNADTGALRRHVERMSEYLRTERDNAKRRAAAEGIAAIKAGRASIGVNATRPG